MTRACQKQGTQESRRGRIHDPRHGSREISSLGSAASSSRQPWRRQRRRRRVDTHRGGPYPSAADATQPSSPWPSNPRAFRPAPRPGPTPRSGGPTPAAPPARPPARLSVHLQQAVPPAVRPRGAAEPEAWALATRRRDPRRPRRRC